jgi:hypothetical protein
MRARSHFVNTTANAALGCFFSHTHASRKWAMASRTSRSYARLSSHLRNILDEREKGERGMKCDFHLLLYSTTTTLGMHSDVTNRTLC